MATFTSSDIASVQLNGSIDISTPSKTVTGNYLELSYSVTPAQTTEITSVALLKADGTVLAQYPIFVPVDQGPVLKHKITVQEGVTATGG